MPESLHPAASHNLPSFITAAPRIPTPAESLDAPQPILDAPPMPAEPAETAAPAVAEDAVAESRLAPRGRRRRLRSPYGFQNGGDETPAAPNTEPTSE